MTPEERVEAFDDEAKGRCFNAAGIGGANAYHKWFHAKLVEMVRAAEIEALEWAALNADAHYRGEDAASDIRFEIERRKSLR